MGGGGLAPEQRPLELTDTEIVDEAIIPRRSVRVFLQLPVD